MSVSGGGLWLVDIGNTNVHQGLADAGRMVRTWDEPTALWREGRSGVGLPGGVSVSGVVWCAVVPSVAAVFRERLSDLGVVSLEVTAATVRGVGVDYPRPETIGPDRLANASGARRSFGAPVIVVDFGTAVTFDVVDARGMYVGGVIAPGLSAMTDYLHEKTALLPRVRLEEPASVIGRSTEEAMRVGAVWGYRGLVREIVGRLRECLGGDVPVVATGGCAALVASGLPELAAVRPDLTLEGLRLEWELAWRGSPQTHEV